MRAERPNVLLVVLDTARADSFSVYADGRKTPTVDQLARIGVAHPKAIAPSCWTVPSHAAMLFGDAPRTLGMCSLPNREARLLAEVADHHVDRSLPEFLRRAGYHTAGISANLWVSTRHGFGTGFEEFHDASGHRVRRMANNDLRSQARWYLDALHAAADDGARAVETMLADWISASPRRPFFWFVNLIECHSPYLPPKPFNDYGPLRRLAAARDARRFQTLPAVLRAAATGVPPPRGARRRMRHLYDRSVELMDAWLARVLDGLDRHRLLDDTLIIVTSDHGENFGEANGLIGHGGSLDDRLLWVPLVLAGPGSDETTTTGVTSLTDLPRLVADAVGLSDHPWGNVRTPGIAVAQYDGPLPLSAGAGTELFSWNPTPEGVRRLTQRFTSATDGTLKLVRSESGESLYDLEADPLERQPVDTSGYPSERIARLRAAIDDVDEREWQGTVGEAPAAEDPQKVAELEERMRLLGYL